MMKAPWMVVAKYLLLFASPFKNFLFVAFCYIHTCMEMLQPWLTVLSIGDMFSIKPMTKSNNYKRGMLK